MDEHPSTSLITAIVDLAGQIEKERSQSFTFSTVSSN